MDIAIIFHMAGLAEDSKLGMWVLGVMIEVSRCEPDSVEAMIDLAPAYFAFSAKNDLEVLEYYKQADSSK